MKKRTIAITLAFMLMIPTAVFANLPNLTIQEATTRAVNNSRGIRNTQDSITLLEEGEQRIREIIWDTPVMPTATFIEMQANMMRLDANRAVSLSSITAQRETLGFIVTNHFANITMAQNELALFEESLLLLERDVASVRLMQNLGMASHAQLDQLLASQRQAENNRVNLELSLDAAFRELNRIMGSRQNERYHLVFEPHFQSVSALNLTHYIQLHQNNSLQIEQAQNQLRIARFEHDNHAVPFNPITSEVIVGGPTRNERAVAVTQANREVTNAREQVENNVIDLHNNIRNLEIAIESMQLQLGILEQSLAISQLQYSVGHLTAIELNRAKLSLAELQENIRRQQVNHHLMVMQLTNPNIALGF